MKQVAYTEFHKYIGNLNVKLRTNGDYPYTTYYKLNGVLVGKAVDYYPTKYKWPIKTKYYIGDNHVI